ncbi:Chitinase 1 [Colletotrichum fructicola]|uniref:chitinase n=1 Tax=Colletotrichum fructicola (strain Nara gc5) TaxID=1213859 RepID=A0A7J6IFU6_COLFN|nr:Chitinase 1 [Colletotrichum fructicola]KAE9566097.1 Chitinase 1 [Colletotrichum fructicola]KAF4474255.1 Chitinase 1 [Colletotrichum fructicola Nara gc5]
MEYYRLKIFLMLQMLAISGASFQNAVYYPNWSVYGRNFHPQMLPTSRITHVLYAFVNIAPSGEVFSADSWADSEKRYPTDSVNSNGEDVYGCVKQLYLLKQANRHLKVILSVGGATWSSHFATVARSEQSRQLFAKTSVSLMKDWGFDGIDVDWEYPETQEEARDYVLLLQTVRHHLDAYAAKHAPSYHFQLSIASPAGPQKYEKLDLSSISNVVDCLYLMAYDYSGAWDSVAAHQANLYSSTSRPQSTPFSTDAAVSAYIAAGVPSRKIVLGMPVYGRSFQNTAGLGDPFSEVGRGSWQDGVWDNKDLPRPGAREEYDATVGATYSWDPATRELISYDSPLSVQQKAAFIKSRRLGGAMFWEASADKVGNASLIAALHNEIGVLEPGENHLCYTDSKYANVAKGMVAD